ncbi:MAG: GTPase Era [Rickettsiales bacterium]|nr:GTPase Era [Rickettsiales bacterium]
MNQQKTNWITLMGTPNVGKSTLLNALMGQKISIVTRKPQTTRNVIKGIKIINSTQLIFIDTPGIFAPKNEKGKLMVKLAWQNVVDSNQVFLITDISQYNSNDNLSLIAKLKQENVKASLIINKIDLIKREELLPVISAMKDLYPFENIFLISALKKDGFDKLLEYLIQTAIEEPWPFAEDEITDAPLKFQITEVIREKIFINTHEEIPYNVEVRLFSMKQEQNLISILVDILVKNQNYKKILIGKKASLIKRIGMYARMDLEKMLGKKVFLSTNVKVESLHD